MYIACLNPYYTNLHIKSGQYFVMANKKTESSIKLKITVTHLFMIDQWNQSQTIFKRDRYSIY